MTIHPTLIFMCVKNKNKSVFHQLSISVTLNFQDVHKQTGQTTKRRDVGNSSRTTHFCKKIIFVHVIVIISKQNLSISKLSQTTRKQDSRQVLSKLTNNIFDQLAGLKLLEDEHCAGICCKSNPLQNTNKYALCFVWLFCLSFQPDRLTVLLRMKESLIR